MTVAVERAPKRNYIANLLLGGGSICCAFVFFYFLYHYGWAGDRSFTRGTGVVVYYILPAFLAAFLFASLKLPPSLKRRFALLLFYFAGLIFVVETALNISSTWFSLPAMADYNKIRERAQAAKKYGVRFDTRTIGEFLDDLREKGIEAYPKLPTPGFLKQNDDGTLESAFSINGTEFLPLGGISNKTTVLCNESGEYVVYQSDERGFHNPKGLWHTKRLQIAAFGDSFTVGYCVPSDQNFVALLRQHGTTVNLGIYGDGPLFTLGKIKEYLPSLRPKIILWFFCEQNDIGDLEGERYHPLLMRYLTRSFTQDLINRQEDIDRALVAHVKTDNIATDPSNKELFQAMLNEVLHPSRLLYRIDEIVRLSRLRRRLGMVYGTNTQEKEIPRVNSEATMDLLAEVLQEAKNSVQTWDGKLYFVYLPQWQRYAQPQLARKHRDRVLRLLKELEIPVIDIHLAFLAHGDPLALFPFREYGHYNVEGHRVVAQEVLRYIAQDEQLALTYLPKGSGRLVSEK